MSEAEPPKKQKRGRQTSGECALKLPQSGPLKLSSPPDEEKRAHSEERQKQRTSPLLRPSPQPCEEDPPTYEQKDQEPVEGSAAL